MTFITDKVVVENGAEYTFVCSKIPFAVSFSSHLPHEEYNFMDLDLINRMKIPLQKIKVERCSIMGQTFRAVGFVSQTVQCVHQGKILGNIHVTARVVRDLLHELDNIKKEDCGPVAKDSKPREVETAAAIKENNDRLDNGRDEEVNIGDIPWNWGYKDDPTTDDYHPTSSATNHVIQARAVPHKFYGKKKYRY